MQLSTHSRGYRLFSLPEFGRLLRLLRFEKWQKFEKIQEQKIWYCLENIDKYDLNITLKNVRPTIVKLACVWSINNSTVYWLDQLVHVQTSSGTKLNHDMHFQQGGGFSTYVTIQKRTTGGRKKISMRVRKCPRRWKHAQGTQGRHTRKKMLFLCANWENFKGVTGKVSDHRVARRRRWL